MPVDSTKLGQKLLEIWGIDTLKVTNIVLQLEVSEPAVVTIEFYPSHEDMILAIEELRNYNLVETEEE